MYPGDGTSAWDHSTTTKLKNTASTCGIAMTTVTFAPTLMEVSRLYDEVTIVPDKGNAKTGIR